MSFDTRRGPLLPGTLYGRNLWSALSGESGGKCELAFARLRALIDAQRMDALRPLAPQAFHTTAITRPMRSRRR
jgi:hypothetical protein